MGGDELFAQNCVAGHVALQAPQCLGSNVVSMQCSLQQTNDPVHATPASPHGGAQTPLPHTRPALHSWSSTQRLQSPFVSHTPLAHRDSHVPASCESAAPEAVSMGLSARFPPPPASTRTVTSAFIAASPATPASAAPAPSETAGARPMDSEHPTKGTTIQRTLVPLRRPDAFMKLPCRNGNLQVQKSA